MFCGSEVQAHFDYFVLMLEGDCKDKTRGHKVHRRYSRTFAGYAQDGLMVEGEKPMKRERPQIGDRKRSDQEKRRKQK